MVSGWHPRGIISLVAARIANGATVQPSLRARSRQPRSAADPEFRHRVRHPQRRTFSAGDIAPPSFTDAQREPRPAPGGLVNTIAELLDERALTHLSDRYRSPDVVLSGLG
jgi:hypothetical protein